MKSRVILLCGKVCSGKTTYALKLKSERNAAVLSIDDLMLSLFDEYLGGRHAEVLEKCEAYLLRIAAEFAGAGAIVVLDFGFWTKESRRAARDYFARRDIDTELHYLPVDETVQRARIERRNRAIRDGKAKGCYTIDENMIRLFAARFEAPCGGEADVVVDQPVVST